MTWQVFTTADATAAAMEQGLSDGRVAHRCIVTSAIDLPGEVGETLARGFRRVVIEGEDPDIAAVVAEVHRAGVGRQTELAVITRRSDLMRTFAADQTVSGAVDRLVHHRPYLIDAGLVEGRFGSMVFVNSVAAGVAAGGPGWFPWWPFPVLPTRRLSVTTGDTATDSVAAGVLVLNGQFWSDRVAAPRSTMVDGVLDVQVFNGHRVALTRLRRSMRSGMHVRSHHIRRRALSEAVIDAPSAWSVAVDGIRVGRGAFRIACLPGAVRLAI